MKVAELKNFVFASVVCGETRISNAAIACLVCLEAFGLDDVPDEGERPKIPGEHGEVDYWYDWYQNNDLYAVFEWAAGHTARWHHRLERLHEIRDRNSTTDQPSPAELPG